MSLRKKIKGSLQGSGATISAEVRKMLGTATGNVKPGTRRRGGIIAQPARAG